MKLMKKKGDDSSIRKVVADDGVNAVGIVGKVGDLLDRHLMEYEGNQDRADRQAWVFVSLVTGKPQFGSTRVEALGGMMG